MGPIRLRPSEIAAIPRGVRFHVSVVQGPIRGYMLETSMAHFELPELGVVGSGGLVNPREL